MVHLIRFLSKSPEETREFGRKLGLSVAPGDVLALTGDLGSGKSVLARGVLESLGVKGSMPSPSFVIVATYDAPVPVNHIDLYRLEAPGEAFDLGLEELLYSCDICIVEWADRLEGFLPASRVDVELKGMDEAEHRLISVRTGDPAVGTRLIDFASSLVRFEEQ